MKRWQLKEVIRAIIMEAIQHEVFGFGGSQRQSFTTPQQKSTVELLVARGFKLEGHVKQEGRTVVRLSRPFGRGRHGEPRYAYVYPDGTINDKIPVDQYLRIVGESMEKPIDHRFDQGRELASMGAVNVGEAGFKLQDEGLLGPKPRKCDCGSGEWGNWEYDAQNIPLVFACDKCRKQKLSRYRPEILRGYDQPDVDEPIEPDDPSDLFEQPDEQTSTGAVAGTIATPFAFKKKNEEEVNEQSDSGGAGPYASPYWGSKNYKKSRATKAAEKYGKVVKSISEIGQV